jgi:hypothetical protein
MNYSSRVRIGNVFISNAEALREWINRSEPGDVYHPEPEKALPKLSK